MPPNRLTISELQRLLDSIHDSIKPRPPTLVTPVYDMANVILCILHAMGAFRDPWRGRLRLHSRSAVPPEHWTRIKALARRFAELNRTEYDTLRPVADFITRLIERVSVVLRCRRLQPSQEVTEMHGGMVRARLRLDSLEEVESWVLSMGTHATVVRPMALVERVAWVGRELAGRCAEACCVTREVSVLVF